MAEMKTIPPWDRFVRLFHWSLVAGFGVCYLTRETAYELHLLAGYIVLGLVLARITWGLVGGRHARFSDFLYLPARIAAYLRGFVRGHAERYIGHTPAGGAMIVLLLTGILIVTLSGIALDGAENRAGPLGATTIFTLLGPIRRVHDVATDITLVLIAGHVLAVLVTRVVHGENLPRAMLSGRKKS